MISFYWFELSGQDALPAWHTPAPAPLPELRTRVFKAPLAEMLEATIRKYQNRTIEAAQVNAELIGLRLAFSGRADAVEALRERF